MIAFEVSINGKRRFIAGHADAKMLSLWLSGTVSDIPGIPNSFGMMGTVAIPGAVSGQYETLTYPPELLALGDEVVIRVVDVERADEPRRPDDGAYRIEFTTTD